MDDLIRRQDAIDIATQEGAYGYISAEELAEMPSAEPEIIYCKYCRKHNQGINEAPYLTDRCPLILHRGYAQGHEFDYQYCVYAERKEDE